MELEEKQMREDRQHQLQMIQMLGQTIQGKQYLPQAYSFDNHHSHKHMYNCLTAATFMTTSTAIV